VNQDQLIPAPAPHPAAPYPATPYRATPSLCLSAERRAGGQPGLDTVRRRAADQKSHPYP